jgi:hypothetical protein
VVLSGLCLCLAVTFSHFVVRMRSMIVVVVCLVGCRYDGEVDVYMGRRDG